MITEAQVRKIVEDRIRGTNKFLVDITINSGNGIYIEVDGDNGVSIGDCAQLSRYVEGRLDREVEDFELKVSSPGLDQPFKVERQYQNALGTRINVILKDGQLVEGNLAKHTKDGIILDLEKVEPLSLIFSEIKETKKVISFNRENHG